jgi:hypothetical protein
LGYSAATVAPFKVGDTFALYAEIKDEAGAPSTIAVANLRAQVRNASGKLYAELAITATETVGKYLLRAESAVTALWPVGSLFFDIERTIGGVVTSSETVTIPVIKDVTRADAVL